MLCEGVSIYTKKRHYHKLVCSDSHLQVIAVQVTVVGGPISALSVYIAGNYHFITNDLSYLIRNSWGYLFIMGDFNGNSLTTSTPGIALRSMLKVLPDTHCSDHCPILTSNLPSVADIQPSWHNSHWVFSKADWEQFHDLCLEVITEDILEEAEPLHFFVITKAANENIPRGPPFPKNRTLGLMRNAGKPWRLDKPTTRVRQSREFKGETLSAFRGSQAQARRLFNHKEPQSWAEYVSKFSIDTPIQHVYGVEWGLYLLKYLPSLAISKSETWYCPHKNQRYC